MSTYFEYEFVTSLLADPVQFHTVNKVHSSMFEDAPCRALMEVIEKNNGRISPAIIHQDLQETLHGTAALEHFADSFQMAFKDAIDHLFTVGQTAPSADSLVERIIDDAMKRMVQQAIGTIKRDRFPSSIEWSQALVSAIQSRTAHLGGGASLQSISDGVDDAIASWQFRMANPGKISGIRIGMGEFDESIGGFQPGDLAIYAAHSGEGKTQAIVHQAMTACKTPLDLTGVPPKVAVFSLEMSKRQLAERFIQKLARVSMREPMLDATQQAAIMDAGAELKALGASGQLIMVEPHACASLGQINRELVRLRTQENIEIAFIDYAQLISVTADSKYLAMAAVSQQLKAMALQLEIPIILAAQLNREALRESKNARPKIYHIADGHDLVRSADYLNMIWTPARHMNGNTGGWGGVAVWITEKVRNGPGLPELYFQAEYNYSTLTPVNATLEKSLRGKTNQDILRGVKPEPKKAAA